MSKRIVILGAAESGVGAAILAAKQGFDVFVSDSGPIKPQYAEMLKQYQIAFEQEKHTRSLILNADEVVKSPGIPEKAIIIKEIREKEIPVISEIEFAGRYSDAYKICITGSNGKTTTTSLIYHMMKKAGLNVGLAGNIGKSFALSVAEDNFDYYVLEISSFQLDGMYGFKADIAILLNITPDHLDRYEYNMQNYVDSKFRIIQNLTEDEYFIYCSDDQITIRELERIVTKAQQLPFSQAHKQVPGAYLEENMIHYMANETDFNITIEELSLKGRHNVYNSMAAGLAGIALNIRKPIIREALMDFVGVEHRLEPVLKVRGVQYINDSKATNVNSTWYALECMNTKVIWIAGGQDKGNDYSELFDLVKDKVSSIVCLGIDNSKIIKAFGNVVEQIYETRSMKECINKCYTVAKPGETVLLSPACASFDLFENYEDRGHQFKKAVREL
jgi:UDP-N-acetylmuramoylalanine--D-glutamate ligase